MPTGIKEELRSLYADASKHSTYQSIPDFVSQELGYSEAIDEGWRGDRPRLAWLTALREPQAGESWLDFGANTGFFTLSLAHEFPQTRFTAIEANPNHAHFIERVAQHFNMVNVEVLQRAMGLGDLQQLPLCDCLLHLNVLHHAGHDFDSTLVPEMARFSDYARRYLKLLGHRTGNMFFQLGSNWGGDKQQPLVGLQEDERKIEVFSGWLQSAGWHINAIGYATHGEGGNVLYKNLPDTLCNAIESGDAFRNTALQTALSKLNLNAFPGEFYRRPLFACDSGGDVMPAQLTTHN